MPWSRLSTTADLTIVAASSTTAIVAAQYVSIKYTERLAEAGIEPSVGSGGDSYDSALAETINGLYKAKVIHRRGPWRSFEGVEYATLEWVDWFNNRRLLEPIGNIKPKTATTQRWTMCQWLRNLYQIASGNPGAVHCRVEPVP
jgi:transposase InsO family protein